MTWFFRNPSTTIDVGDEVEIEFIGSLPGSFELYADYINVDRNELIFSIPNKFDESTWFSPGPYIVSNNNPTFYISSAVGWLDSFVLRGFETTDDVVTTSQIGISVTGDTHTYVPDETVTQEGLDLLLWQFKNSTLARGLLSAYLDEIQKLRLDAYHILHGRNIDSAARGALDGLGDILGLERGTLRDSVYRKRLKAQRAILKSNGTLNELINVLYLLLNLTSKTDIRAQVYDPEAVYFRVQNHRITDIDPDKVGELLRRASPSGHNIQLIYTVAEDDDNNLFRFSDTAGASETSSSHGFGNGTFAGAA